VFSALEVGYENALYKFTFDIDIDIDTRIHKNVYCISTLHCRCGVLCMRPRATAPQHAEVIRYFGLQVFLSPEPTMANVAVIFFALLAYSTGMQNLYSKLLRTFM